MLQVQNREPPQLDDARKEAPGFLNLKLGAGCCHPDVWRFVKKRGVNLMSSGLDAAPMAYKDIDEVMDAQSDLVDPMTRFDPKLVRMAKGR